MSEEIRNEVETTEEGTVETYEEQESKSGFDVKSGLIGAGVGLLLVGAVKGFKAVSKKRKNKDQDSEKEEKPKKKGSFLKKFQNIKKTKEDVEEEFLDEEEIEKVEAEVVK